MFEYNETQDSEVLTFTETEMTGTGEQYSQFLLCPECDFEDGHSPECQTKPAKLYREVSELLSEVYGGEYGTKNKATLILKLQSIKSLL